MISIYHRLISILILIVKKSTPSYSSSLFVGQKKFSRRKNNQKRCSDINRLTAISTLGPRRSKLCTPEHPQQPSGVQRSTLVYGTWQTSINGCGPHVLCRRTSTHHELSTCNTWKLRLTFSSFVRVFLALELSTSSMRRLKSCKRRC